jgi:hypothetical protein
MPEPLDLNRLRRHAPTTLVCLPENADPAHQTSDVAAVANLTGDVLRHIRARLDMDPTRGGSLPAPLGDHGTVAAVARLEAAIGDAYRRIPARPVTAGGTELTPLRWTQLARDDVAALGRTGRALGTAVLPPANELVAGLLQDLLHERQRPQDLVADIARLHGLLELAWDDDVALLAAQLTPGDLPRKMVLDHAAVDAYRRVTDRIVAIWHLGDPLASWLYRGD